MAAGTMQRSAVHAAGDVKPPVVQRPGLTQEYPGDATMMQLAPTGTAPPDTQLVVIHASNPAPTIGTTHSVSPASRQEALAAKTPSVHSPGLTHVYPITGTIVQAVPLGTMPPATQARLVGPRTTMLPPLGASFVTHAPKPPPTAGTAHSVGLRSRYELEPC